MRRPGSVFDGAARAPPLALGTLRKEADEVVCLEAPSDFGRIGMFYVNFHQIVDEEIIATLKPEANENCG